jgi:RNA-directed DNA polymerase
MDRQKIKNKKFCIIDDSVFNNDENVALPKDDFAVYVLTQKPNFNNLDHSEFRKIFDIIYKIIIENGWQYSTQS